MGDFFIALLNWLISTFIMKKVRCFFRCLLTLWPAIWSFRNLGFYFVKLRNFQILEQTYLVATITTAGGGLGWKHCRMRQDINSVRSRELVPLLCVGQLENPTKLLRVKYTRHHLVFPISASQFASLIFPFM